MIADGMRDSFAQSRRTARVMGFSCEMSLSECRMFQTMGGRDGSILCAAVAASTAWCIQPMMMSGRTRRVTPASFASALGPGSPWCMPSVSIGTRKFRLRWEIARKGVVVGKGGSVRVDIGGRRSLKKKNQHQMQLKTDMMDIK